MTKRIRIVVKVLFALVVIFGMVFLIANYNVYRTEHRMKRFFEDVLNEQYEKAFDSVYYFEVSVDIEPEIKYEDAKQIWVARVKEAKSNKTYLAGFSKVNAYVSDSYMNGSARLTFFINGKEYEEDFYIGLSLKDNEWKISSLQVRSNEEDFSEFEKMIRGYVGEN